MMKPKFQIGERIRIREDVPNCGYGPDGVWCNEDMYAHQGREFKIKTMYGTKDHPRYLLADPSHSFEDDWVWEESFLELVETNVEIDITHLL